VVLSVGGQPVSTFREVELATTGPVLKMEVLRRGQRLPLEVPTVDLGSDETTKVLLWAGAVLQKPPQAVARQVEGLVGSPHVLFFLSSLLSERGGQNSLVWGLATDI
jgi:hypothetical protein